MRYSWNSVKDVLDQRKHGLSLADGISALEDINCESWEDDRFDYEEERIVTLGRNKDTILAVVSTVLDSVAEEE